jgi:hypothetical protein
MQEKMTLETLIAMDGGRIAQVFNREVERLTSDCEDRPALKKARKLTLTLTLLPVPTDEGDLDSVFFNVALDVKAPKKESKVYSAAATKDGLFYNELAPENARQQTIPMRKAGS